MPPTDHSPYPLQQHATATLQRDRAPLVVSVVALLVGLLALLLVVLDGACRPDPVPAGQPGADDPPPVAPPIADKQLRTSDPGEVAP